MKKRSILSWLLVYCLCFAITMPTLAAEISNKQQLLETMNQYIDESIVGEEREVMQEILLNVEPENRENVVYIDENDNIYATNPDLKESITNVVIQATGYDVNGNKKTYLKRAEAQGWRVDGTNCCLKRVITISQNGQNLHSGSYMKNISWSNWKIGTSSTKNADWSTKDTQVNVVYPSAVYAKYSMTNHANDTVSILYNN